jgi:glycosyltransferase involved in cell wall biosynthesis
MHDLKSVNSVDHFIANSHFVAERIKRIYRRNATVIHPPVDTDFFSQGQYEKRDYYLFVGQLIPYKRPDLAIEACGKLGCPLVVVGDGPLREKLQKQTGKFDKITFVGRCGQDHLRRLYAEAKALLFPGVEDFGIVSLEAQAAGTPVVAFAQGGALETVVSAQTGLFFKEANAEALCNVIEEFEASNFNSNDLKQHAVKFNPSRFREQISNFLTTVGKNNM